MNTITNKDGRIGEIYATVDTIDDNDKPVRYYWVTVEGKQERWDANECVGLE